MKKKPNRPRKNQKVKAKRSISAHNSAYRYRLSGNGLTPFR